MRLSLQSRFCGNVYVIQCKGRIVAGEEVKALEAALDKGAREFTRFVLNMSEVEGLDSTGLGLLVRYADRMAQRRGGVRLAALPESVEALLTLTKLSRMLQSYPTEDDAIVSFLKQRSAEETRERSGPRVLFHDVSADLCVFVRTVLKQHGYDVRSTCSFRDAKILLQVDGVEYILVGPGTPLLSSETVLTSLRALAPGAAVLQLDADFKARDAHQATEALLQMFGANGAL